MAMTLVEAVQEVVDIINSGRAAREFPPGRRGSCTNCPIAKFLSKRVGMMVCVGTYITIYEIDERVTTPSEIAEWIMDFDRRG